MKKFCIISFVLCSFISYAQETDILQSPKVLRNNVFSEIGGISGGYGFHYERTMFVFENSRITACIGYAKVDLKQHIEVIPFRVRLVFGSSNHFFQIEKGFMYHKNNKYNSVAVGYSLRTQKGLYLHAGGLIVGVYSFGYPSFGLGYMI